MAVITPPLALQGGAILHDAALFRRAYQGLLINDNEGIGRFNGTSDMAVSQNSPTGMSVLVARGGCYVKGDQATDQGVYFCYNDGNTAVTISAADLTNPRIDLIVAEVRDNFHGVSGDDWRLRSVTGTPSASPAAPALPASCLELARVSVAANTTAITNANITDRRFPISPIGGTHICTATTRPATPWEGMKIYETDTDKVQIWDGGAWSNYTGVWVGTSGSPPGGYEGRVFYATDTDRLMSYNGSAWVVVNAGGQLGYAEVTANQTGITSETDLTGLSVAVTVGANRRIKITGQGHVTPQTSVGTCVGRIKEGATNLGRWAGADGGTPIGNSSLEIGSAILTPSAGSHTYKLTLQKFTGGNTVDLTAATGLPAFILVEDIGSA